MAEHWIQKAVHKMEQKGTVGSFTKAAKKAGKSTSAMESSVLKSGSHASAKMKKKAQFAKNMHGGNTVVSAGSMKGQSMGNRSFLLKDKAAFRKGNQRYMQVSSSYPNLTCSIEGVCHLDDDFSKPIGIHYIVFYERRDRENDPLNIRIMDDLIATFQKDKQASIDSDIRP